MSQHFGNSCIQLIRQIFSLSSYKIMQNLFSYTFGRSVVKCVSVNRPGNRNMQCVFARSLVHATCMEFYYDAISVLSLDSSNLTAQNGKVDLQTWQRVDCKHMRICSLPLQSRTSGVIFNNTTIKHLQNIIHMQCSDRSTSPERMFKKTRKLMQMYKN